MCKKKFNYNIEPLNTSESILAGISERLEYIAELLEKQEENAKKPEKLEVVEEVKQEEPVKKPRARKTKETK